MMTPERAIEIACKGPWPPNRVHVLADWLVDDDRAFAWSVDAYLCDNARVGYFITVTQRTEGNGYRQLHTASRSFGRLTSLVRYIDFMRNNGAIGAAGIFPETHGNA